LFLRGRGSLNPPQFRDVSSQKGGCLSINHQKLSPCGRKTPFCLSQLNFYGGEKVAKKLSKETVIIEVQLAKSDYERLVKNASERGFITLSEYIRNALRNA